MARTIAPGKMTRLKPSAWSSGPDRIGVCPPSTMLAISGRGAAERGDDVGELRAGAGRFDEQHVGAGLGVEAGPVDGGGEAFHGDRVGAGDDERGLAGAGIDGGADLPGHLAGCDQPLVGEVAAALGKALVLELDGARARTLEQLHRPLHVERVAVAGVGVDDDGRGDPLAHQAEGLGHFGHGDEADVGPAEARVGDGRAGEIQRLEPRRLGERGGERVVDAGRDDDPVLREALAQSARWGIGLAHHGHIPR